MISKGLKAINVRPDFREWIQVISNSMFSCTIDKQRCTFPFFNLYCGVKHFSAVWNAGRLILAVKVLSCVIRSDNKTEAGVHIHGKENRTI